MKNFTQKRPDKWSFRTTPNDKGQFTEVLIDYLKGAKCGVYASAIPWTNIGGTESCPIFQMVQVCIFEMPRKNDKAVVQYAEILDDVAPELAKAFEANAKAGFTERLRDAFGEKGVVNAIR
jgi:hypothetical protein